ncbi:hypothetical protein [Clostridium lundense]|uniref:hypothetical protein n=1 Tax=Clostridium lundense TaxID=319475 RepID=UPI0012EB4B87|nr:hypothetical protein [Clostridium lundense]
MKKILDTLILFIKKLANKSKFIIKEVNNKIVFLKRNGTIIKNAYDNILKEKLKTTDNLLNKVNELKIIDNNINKEISYLKSQNKSLENKIEILSDLIVTSRSEL